MGRLLSVGHGTAGREALTELFRGAGAHDLVDVRRFPGSRRNPDVGSDAMAEWLPTAGIDYRWDPRLGGRRRVPRDQDPDLDGWWRVTAFRGYAAHMRTAEFRAGLAELVAMVTGAQAHRTVLFLCSESVWWRCHRRMISDAAVLLHGLEVLHLGHNGKLSAHQPAAGARVAPDGCLYYDRDESRTADLRT